METQSIRTAGKWGFWALAVSAVILLILAGIFIYQYSGRKNVVLTLSAPGNALLGIPFQVEARVFNNADKPLQDVIITLLLPDGTFGNETKDRRVIEKAAGVIEPGQTYIAHFPVAIYKGVNTVHRFPVTASYTLAGVASGAKIDTQKAIEVSARESALALDISAPEQVLNNDAFDLTINYRNNSDIDLGNIELEAGIPQNVTIISAVPATASSTTRWMLPILTAQSGGIISLKAKAMGADASFFEIKIAGTKDKHALSEKTVSIAIAPSPLSLSIRLENTPQPVYPGQTLNYILTYRNNTDAAMRDVVVKAKIKGDMFDFGRVSSRGAYDSANKTISWNAAAIPDLEAVPPGASGSVNFTISAKNQYPIKKLADKNFILRVDGEISSPTIPYYVSADKTAAVAFMETKVGGGAAIQRTIAFKDPSGFENRGPMPLKANSPTSLTVHWIITNYSTDIKDVTVKTSALAGVRLTGKIKSSAQTAPVWNERTGEISWTIDRILATKGVLGKPVESVFQIEVTPNITQINQPIALIGETNLTAIDEFTGATVEASAPSLGSDSIAESGNNGMVTP